MASLSVRKLDSNIYERLRIRAANHGVSMEEEARRIISEAVNPAQKISEVFKKYFGPDNGVDLDIPPQRKPHEAMDFDK